ncbi:MAG: type III-B CRISPR-associated protein Cas10/Cmr2, partial [Thermoproteus sp.]
MDWFAKAWALLHDPPYKALWPLGYKPLGGATHEEEARKLLDLILQGTKLGGGAPDEKTARAVQAADVLASSFDRWALAPEGEAKYWVRPKELVNPFNPAMKAPLEIPAFDDLKKRVEIFARKVNEAVKAAGDEREAYFALYAAYELAWIAADLPALPADTRMPTHTIFDHLYAT